MKNKDVKKFREELLQKTLDVLEQRSNASNDKVIWSCRREKRNLNWFEKLLLKLGLIDQDYKVVTTIDSNEHEELKFYLQKLTWILHDEPITCSTCGSDNLAPDPSGYYRDAESPYGAWLLCLDCDG